MGIKVEFNPDLALRSMAEHTKGARAIEECIPEPLEEGKVYPFLKQGQRLYWFDGELPLRATVGNQQLSRPKASVRILEAMHFVKEGVVYTRGTYQVVKLLHSNQIYFDGLEKV